MIKYVSVLAHSVKKRFAIIIMLITIQLKYAILT